MEDDEEPLCRFGTALNPFNEDEIPSKKPINIEDQIVVDENGKRRFHGAFTGGFSAGFWNTVGSAEGFTPQQFKSTRSEKQQHIQQKPTDFMDDEDRGEFGIAPQQIKAKPDFGPETSSAANKRKLYRSFDSGPIPGVPALETLVKPANDKVAVRILKYMGWKEGQGVGARLTRVEKKRAKAQNKKEMYILKKYGCDLGPMSQSRAPPDDDVDSDSDSDLSEYEITFAPDDYDPFVVTLKENTFGIGYSGLDKNPILSKPQHVNLFSAFEIHDKNNKKLSIRGQAFGVGALEEEDEDIYARDDMTRYDFSLDDKAKSKPKAIKAKVDSNIVEGFCAPMRGNKKQGKKVFNVNMPEHFQPRNWAQRKSRFTPLDPMRAKQLEDKTKHLKLGLGRHDKTPEERGQLLNDAPVSSSSKEPSKPASNPLLDQILSRSNQFVTTEVLTQTGEIQAAKTEIDKLQTEAKKITEKAQAPSSVFKPFTFNEAKQSRYEKFIAFTETSPEAIDKFLLDLQPLGMSEFDRKLERQEFQQAKKLYKPMDGLMSNRFVSETKVNHEKYLEEKAKAEASAANKPIVLKRTKVMWKPHKDLCKRFNVPEPFGGMMVDEKPVKRTRFSVFDYLEVPVNSRKNFVTPVVVPKQKDLVEKQMVQKKHVPVEPRMTAKEFFNADDDRPKSIPFANKPDEPRETAEPKIAEKIVPLTELETKVVESMDMRPEEKQDLFKSIFCDTSDEEDSEEQAGPSQSVPDCEKLKLIQSIVAIKPASEFNVLRNQSPPRGIFKNLFVAKKKPPVVESPKAPEPALDLYGPKLPEQPIRVATPVDSSDSDSSDLDAKLKHLMRKQKGGVKELWVEKEVATTDSKRKKNKKSEKHKKSKKHKKEKKHKRKKEK